MRRYSLVAIGLVLVMFIGIVVLALSAINRSADPAQVETVIFRARTLDETTTAVWSINDLLTGTQVDTLPPLTVVDVLEGPREGQVTQDALEDWYRIRVGEVRGWVRGRFLDLAYDFGADD